MKTRRMTFTVPIMIIVGIASMLLLDKGFYMIEQSIRTMLVVGGMLITGVISYFLFPDDEGKNKNMK